MRGCGIAQVRLHLMDNARLEPSRGAGQSSIDSMIVPGEAEAKRMRVVRSSAVLAALFAATSASAQNPEPVGSSRERSGSLAKLDADVARRFRYEPTGVSLLRPYARGKIPVLFIHGLWSNPLSWSRMIESLEADRALDDRYQFWTFGYSTGDPIPYSASLLRRDLDEVRRKFDPDGSDKAFDKMVVVGHSMGGLLTKMMVLESGTRLWQVICDRPFDELAGDPADREVLRRVVIFKPRPEVRRVVFISTPHRGSRLDRGGLEHLGSRLVRLPDPLRASYGRLMARNGPEFFKPYFRKGLPTSVDELEWQSPFLMGLDAVERAPSIEAHSIIADRRDPPRAGGTDGLVPYESAHLDGTASEFLVSSGHLCQDNPAVIREVRRILVEHGVR
jgi:pimeloyl-ACP methyl ester carboxylesterase